MKIILILLLFAFSVQAQFIWPVNSGDPGVNNPALATAKDAKNIADIEDFLQHAASADMWYVKSLVWYPTDSSESIVLNSRVYSLTRSFARVVKNDVGLDSVLIDAVHFVKASPLRKTGLILPDAGLPKEYQAGLSLPKAQKDEIKKVYDEKVQKVNADFEKYKDKAVKNGIKVKENGGTQKIKKFKDNAEFRSFCWKVTNAKAEIKE